MRVTLTQRLGRRAKGATFEATPGEADWLTSRGLATRAKDAPANTRPTGTEETRGASAPTGDDTATDDTAKSTTRGRRRTHRTGIDE